jgi:hypothetical protein
VANLARRCVEPALELSAGVLFGAGLAALAAGPLRLDVGDASLSVRTVSRPLVAAAAIFLARALAVPAAERRLVSAHASARVALLAITVAAVLGWIAYRSPTVGGADSYGYVSAAQRIARGSLIEPEPIASMLPFEDAIRAAVPLGYVPSPRAPDASAPAYPLGLPLIMAAAATIGGQDAPFAVAPLMGLILLGAAWLVARAWYADPFVALLGVALLAAHPLVFTYAIQPMSDVPAAACLTLAVAALARERFLLAGAGAGAALLIRPALAPAAAVFVLIPFITRGREGWRASLVAAGPIVCAAAAHALLQNYLYGSVLASGYGSVGGLFGLDRIAVNLRSYTYWAPLSIGLPLLGAAAVGLIVSPRAPRAVVMLMSAAVLVPHLPYRTYDHWETLRFLLPALVLLTITAGSGLAAIARRVAGSRTGPVVAAAVAMAIAWSWIGWLQSQGVFTMPEHERRHRLAAEMAARSTPAGAVILALQHTGSLRYYAGRDTVNWDQMPQGSLRATVRALQEHGRPVYVMTDSDEERVRFRERHGPVLEEDGWLPAGQRRNVQLYEAPHH